MSIAEYAMTDVDVGLVGKTMVELKAVKERIARLKRSADSIGNELSGIGNQLSRNPEKLWFDGDGIDTNFTDRRDTFGEGVRRFKKQAIDSAEVVKIVSELRSCYTQEDKLFESLKGMGFPQERSKRD